MGVGRGADSPLLEAEPSGLPSVEEAGTPEELEPVLDSPAGRMGIEAELELGPLLPAAVGDSAPDVGRLGVVAPVEATEEEADGFEPVAEPSEGAEDEGAEMLAESVAEDCEEPLPAPTSVPLG